MIDKIKKPSQCWLIWNKVQRDFTMSDAEIVWASFDKTIRCFDMSRGGAMGDHNRNGGKEHPTQKPVKLYEWLLMNYAKENDKILDTHGGSMSIAIAVDNMNKINGMNLTLDLCELDEEYFNAGVKRVKNQVSQLKIGF
jgi:site-specific DNA-methyltransferase (adenine-specific)